MPKETFQNIIVDSSMVMPNGSAYFVFIKDTQDPNGFLLQNIKSPNKFFTRWGKPVTRSFSTLPQNTPTTLFLVAIPVPSTGQYLEYIFRGKDDKNPILLKRDFVSKYGFIYPGFKEPTATQPTSSSSPSSSTPSNSPASGAWQFEEPTPGPTTNENSSAAPSGKTLGIAALALAAILILK